MTTEKITLCEKLSILLREFQFIKSLKIWWSMADKVKEKQRGPSRHTLSAMLHQLFNDFILSAILLHQYICRSVIYVYM